jgi:hypothetical protein
VSAFHFRVLVDANRIFSFVVAIVYWFIWTIAVPRWRGYELKEQLETLDDGTIITKLVKIKSGSE